MIKGIIFDLDGTLLNTLTDLSTSVNYALELHGLPCHTESKVCSMVGHGVHNLIDQAVPAGTSAELTASVFDAFRSHYSQHSMDATAPYEGIMPLLTALKARGIATAISSNKYDAAVRALSVRYFGDLIDVAMGESEKRRKKPAPDIIFDELAEMHLEGDSVLYVGDSDTDVETAHNGGLPCVGVTWGFRPESVLVSAGADYIIRRPEELLGLIDRLDT